jgi:hypothetical protein
MAFGLDLFMKVSLPSPKGEENGAPGAIRTPGPQIRSLMLYPAELRVHGEVLLGVAFRIRKTQIINPCDNLLCA